VKTAQNSQLRVPGNIVLLAYSLRKDEVNPFRGLEACNVVTATTVKENLREMLSWQRAYLFHHAAKTAGPVTVLAEVLGFNCYFTQPILDNVSSFQSMPLPLADSFTPNARIWNISTYTADSKNFRTLSRVTKH
jgi:hypothetical protein